MQHNLRVSSQPTLYDVLGVDPRCNAEQLRAAYRSEARRHHPDVTSCDDGGAAMGRLNDAWRILSDPARRSEYDATLRLGATSSAPAATPQPPPGARLSRRAAWVAGVQAQIVRLSRLAGRSATQTLLLRSPRADRATYDAIVDLIVRDLAAETEARVRAARAAGAAPLDLGVAASLIGIRTLADSLRRDSSLGVTRELVMTAELLDRMWDVLAHELPHGLTAALGGNPHVARRLLNH